MPSIDLVVRANGFDPKAILRPEFFRSIENQNRLQFNAKWCILGKDQATSPNIQLAESLVQNNIISGYATTGMNLSASLRSLGLTSSNVRSGGDTLANDLLIGLAGVSRYVLAWRADAFLKEPHDWIPDAIQILEEDRRIFSVSPVRASIASNTYTQYSHHDCIAPHQLTWTFDAAVFLARRSQLSAPIYGYRDAAARIANFANPWSYQARLESYQRKSRRPRVLTSQVILDLPGEATEQLSIRRLLQRSSMKPYWMVATRARRSGM